jgi:hypothetical protein
LKESRRAKGAGQVPQNYMPASRIPKKKFVAKQFALAEICRDKLLRDRFLLKQIALGSNLLSIAKQISSRSNLLRQKSVAKQTA